MEKSVQAVFPCKSPRICQQTAVVKLWEMLESFFQGKFVLMRLIIVELKFKKSGQFCGIKNCYMFCVGKINIL